MTRRVIVQQIPLNSYQRALEYRSYKYIDLLIDLLKEARSVKDWSKADRYKALLEDAGCRAICYTKDGDIELLYRDIAYQFYDHRMEIEKDRDFWKRRYEDCKEAIDRKQGYKPCHAEL